MKKILLLLSIVLIFTTFTGCKKKTSFSPSNPVTITMWHVYGEQADSPMNSLVEEFNATVGKENGITVTVTNISGTSKIGEQLFAAKEEVPGALEMPDIFSCHTATALSLGTENLVDFQKYFTEEELKNYVPEFLEDGTMDGKLNIFPVSKSSYALFVNGSQFQRFSKETGITYDKLSTWEGFFEAAKKYYQWSEGKPFCAFDYLIRHIELDILSKGEEIKYTENGWYDMEQEALKETWEMFSMPFVQGHITISDLYANTQVMTGECLAGIGSTAAVNYYNDTVTYPDNTSEDMNLKVLPLPKSGEGQQYMPQTGVGFAVYQTEERKAEAASVFIRWFTQGKRNLDFVVETGYLPVHNEAFEAIDTYQFPSKGHESLYEAIRMMRQNYIPVVRPDFPGYYEKTDTLYAGLREMQPMLKKRVEDGEAPEILVGETWDFFQSIE